MITIEPTAVNSNGAQYATDDHLGSPRVITNSSGSVVSRHDYKPFGDDIGSGLGGRTVGMGFSNSGDNNRKKFTGYERDTETGLDFARARFYSNLQGRFTSPDTFSASASTTNPQSFSRYAYVNNNPTVFSDPTGLAAHPAMMSMSGDINAMFRQHDSSNDIAEAEADYEGRLADTYAAIDEANYLNKAVASGTMTADEAKEIAAGNPMLEAQPQNSSATASVNIIGSDPLGSVSSPPQCFAQLKYRPTDYRDSKYMHAFWYVQGSDGKQLFLQAGPERGALNAWPVPIEKQRDDWKASVWFDSGLSANVCERVDHMIYQTSKWPQGQIQYDPRNGPNSNSAARYLGQDKFSFPHPPSNWLGWDMRLRLYAHDRPR